MTATSGRDARKASSAALHVSASSTSYPWHFRKFRIPKRAPASSSTIRILCLAIWTSSPRPEARLRNAREPHGHVGPSLGPATRHDPPAVFFHDPLDDGEPEARPPAPFGEERL